MRLPEWIHYDFLGVAVTAAALAALLAAFGFPRSPLTHRMSTFALALVWLRTLQTFWFNLRAHTQWPVLMVQAWFAFLLFVLLRAYGWGAPSRAFFSGTKQSDSD